MRSLLVVVLLSFTSCGIFDTREPEPPTTGTGFIWTQATSTETLVNNFKLSFEALDGENHKRVFMSPTDSLLSGSSVTYTFLDISGDPDNHPIFLNWNRESEKAYIVKLKALLDKNARCSVRFVDISHQITGNTAVVQSGYEVFIPVRSGTIVPSIVSGKFILQMAKVRTEQGSTEWRVTDWLDQEPAEGEATTWADLKARLS